MESKEFDEEVKDALRAAFLVGCRLGSGYNQETLDSYFESYYAYIMNETEEI